MENIGISGINSDLWKNFRFLEKFQIFGSQVVRNTVRSFGEIHLIMFEKYGKKRSDPDFCDTRTEDRGIRHSSYSKLGKPKFSQF